MELPDDRGRRRVVIEAVEPQVDGGLFPVKRVVGETVDVAADVFTDGHDALSAVLLYWREGDPTVHEAPLEPLPNDRWRGRFTVTAVGRYGFTVVGWVDHFKTWWTDLKKRVDAGQELDVELQIGALLVEEAAARSNGADRVALDAAARALLDAEAERRARAALALDPDLLARVSRHPDRHLETRFPTDLQVVVERERALFGAWYELFPRSCATEPGRHGTLRDVEARLEHIVEMGFDVLYLPPIHPIGRVHRKGANNTTVARPGDPGSPWAIGSEEGGHKSIHPELGSLEDLRHLVQAARTAGLEVALDIAFQVAPDHPYARHHPEWFRQRPDGTIQYAENPPKKYEDIFPFDFETTEWKALWKELEGVVRHWCEQGVRIFRVDNPHTKPFALWRWLIGSIRADYPDALFLAEAFTRPKIMHRLAKVGFSQSYTYFAWRNTKQELTEYARALFHTGLREYFRPSFWPNTPDILTEVLQLGGRPAFMLRAALAATMTATWGIYGPAFELLESEPLRPGSEEYLHSEKYEIRTWDLDRKGNLSDYVGRLNQIRRENPALQKNEGFRFHDIDNEQLIAYSKATEDGSNIILTVANLDPHHRHSGWLVLDLRGLGLPESEPFQVRDLVSDSRFLWHGPRNFVELDPAESPVHVFRLGRRVRTERDFEYYL